MGKKRVLVGYGVNIDAVAGWLGSYGEDSVSDISRGMQSNTHTSPNQYLQLLTTNNQVSGPAI
jgi:hypothetical protein